MSSSDRLSSIQSTTPPLPSELETEIQPSLPLNEEGHLFLWFEYGLYPLISEFRRGKDPIIIITTENNWASFTIKTTSSPIKFAQVHKKAPYEFQCLDWTSSGYLGNCTKHTDWEKYVLIFSHPEFMHLISNRQFDGVLY